MIERLLSFLAGMEAPAAEPKPDELELAVAALLIEAARMDDEFDAGERATIERLLAERYKYDFEKMEKWTLGRTTKELKESGLRKDFIVFLESVVNYRNHIAHDLLANEAMLRTLLGGNAGKLELRNLEKGIYELEQIMFLHDWCEEHNAWG